MNEHEAELLKHLVGCIGGPDKNSPREFFDKIFYALEQEEVKRAKSSSGTITVV